MNAEQRRLYSLTQRLAAMMSWWDAVDTWRTTSAKVADVVDIKSEYADDERMVRICNEILTIIDDGTD